MRPFRTADESRVNKLTRGFSPQAFFPDFLLNYFADFFTISLVDFIPRITFPTYQIHSNSNVQDLGPGDQNKCGSGLKNKVLIGHKRNVLTKVYKSTATGTTYRTLTGCCSGMVRQCTAHWRRRVVLSSELTKSPGCFLSTCASIAKKQSMMSARSDRLAADWILLKGVHDTQVSF